ncbi:MAG: response regulator [Faecalicatena sp.]|uniref:response regulator n=1 Tax=Faecalicatena sp. TaxID=2005360 RepID=UPI00258AC056|nr:response regulator [Faecalicatena sp.]MCI6467808.1 response regulator [Faecalicatena sp.]MDY5619550.1 response regulator [Lachnospiraceae bacterium]
MIRIMLVDDEPFIRVAIRSLFSWEKYDYFIAAEASNGTDALQKLEHEDIDLLITDIKMPVTDGIELLHQVKERYPHIKCVVLSNYEDFELTRKAFLEGAVDYLLKGNLNEENFSALVQRLNANYFQVQSDSFTSNKAPIHRSFEHKVSALQQLISQDLAPDTRNELTHELDMGLPYVISSVKLFSNSPEFTSSEPDTHVNKKLIRNTVFKIISEISEFKLYYYDVSTNEYIFIIYDQDRENTTFFKHLQAFYDQLTSNLFIYLNKFSVIGTSQLRKEVQEISISYQEADTMSDLIFYCRESAQYFFVPDNVNLHADNPVRQFVLSYMETLPHWIKIHAWTALESFFHELLEQFKINLYPPTYSKRIVTNLEFLIMNELTRNFSDNKEFYNDYDHLFDTTMHAAHITSLENITADFLAKIKAAASSLYLLDANCSEIVQQAVTYLQKNYLNPEINLTFIANEIGVNSSYLSRIFHKETEKTFNTYLNFLRIEHAKKLLRTTSDNIVAISEKSGYNNSKYFVNLFKKVEGMSPSAYRNMQADLFQKRNDK